jgi:hypothetical protein
MGRIEKLLGIFSRRIFSLTSSITDIPKVGATNQQNSICRGKIILKIPQQIRISYFVVVSYFVSS